MKLLQFIVSVILLVLALWLGITQSIITSSYVVAGAYFLMTILMGALVHFSWIELKEEYK